MLGREWGSQAQRGCLCPAWAGELGARCAALLERGLSLRLGSKGRGRPVRSWPCSPTPLPRLGLGEPGATLLSPGVGCCSCGARDSSAPTARPHLQGRAERKEGEQAGAEASHLTHVRPHTHGHTHAATRGAQPAAGSRTAAPTLRGEAPSPSPRGTHELCCSRSPEGRDPRPGESRRHVEGGQPGPGRPGGRRRPRHCSAEEPGPPSGRPRRGEGREGLFCRAGAAASRGDVRGSLCCRVREPLGKKATGGKAGAGGGSAPRGGGVGSRAGSCPRAERSGHRQRPQQRSSAWQQQLAAKVGRRGAGGAAAPLAPELPPRTTPGFSPPRGEAGRRGDAALASAWLIPLVTSFFSPSSL